MSGQAWFTLTLYLGVLAALGYPLGERGAHTVGRAGHQRPRTVLKCECHAGSPTGATRTWMNRRRATRQPSSPRTSSSS